MQLTWKTPDSDQNTSLWSEVADGEDYYFVYGPALDQVVAGFRQLTGQASLMPEWAVRPVAIAPALRNRPAKPRRR